SMLIGRDMFEKHVDCLASHFRMVGLDEIGDRLASGEPFDEPVAAITFDDGYRDVYENAYPVLQRRGMRAAMFVVTGLVGRRFWQHHDRLYRLVAKMYAASEEPQFALRDLLHRLGIRAADRLDARAATTTPMAAVNALIPGLSLAD